MREWVVEWDEPELDEPAESTTDAELVVAVRRRLADRDGAADQSRRPDGEPAISADGWMPGEPLC